MNRPARTPPFAGRMRGLSLIELMVSLAIGLVLMVAVVSAYLGSAGASRVAESQGRMNEDAQAALNILAQQLRMAGTNPKQTEYAHDTPRNPVYAAPGGGTPTAFAIRGCDGTFTNVSGTTDIAGLTCTTTTGADSLAVTYEADQYNTVKNSTNAATDCLGQSLPNVNYPAASVPPVKKWNGSAVAAAAVDYKVAENRFYIATATGIGPSLYCKGNGTGGTAGQPLVENVEDLQIRYGMQDDPVDPVNLKLGGYVTATEVEAVTLTNTLPSDSINKWNKVVTARICIVVRSAQPVVPDAASGQYYDCEGTLVTTATDLRLRRAYSTTVVLRNRLASS